MPGFDVGSIIAHLLLDTEKWKSAVAPVLADTNRLRAGFNTASLGTKELTENMAKLGLKTKTELTKELTAARATLDALRRLTEATPGAVEALKKQIEGLERELEGTSRALTKTSGRLPDFKKSLKETGQDLQKVGRDMMIAGGAVVAGFTLMIKKTADFGDSLWDMKQRTGISTEVLSSFKLAADKSGTSLEGVVLGLRFLGRNMADAAQGTGEAAKAFASMGISVRDTAGNLRPMDQVMIEVADRFAAMEDGAAKTDLAIQLFGRSGTELIPMLNLGRAGLAELVEEAKRLGIVIGDEAASKADQFNDTMTALKGSFFGVGITIAQSLMPSIQGFAKVVTEIIAQFNRWASSNSALVQSISGTIAAVASGTLVLGGFLAAAGSIIVKLPLVAATLGTTTAALLLNTAAWSAGAMAIGYYIAKLFELEEAKADAAAASARFSEEQGRIIAKLQEAAGRTQQMVIANRDLAASEAVTSAEMDKIIASYGEGNVALALAAVAAGKHGQLLAAALRQVGDEANALQQKSGGAATALAQIFKTFNLKSKSQLTKELEDAKKALDALRGSTEATPTAITALTKLIIELGHQLDGTTNPIERVKKKLDELNAKIAEVNGFWSKNIDNMIAEWERLAGLDIPLAEVDIDSVFAGWGASGEIAARADETSAVITDIFKQAGVDTEALLGRATEKTKEALGNMKSLWDEFADGLKTKWASVFSEAFQGLFGLSAAEEERLDGLEDSLKTLRESYGKGEISLEEYSEKYKEIHKEMEEITNKFAKFWKGLWNAIKTQFFDIIGQMVARLLTEFLGAALGLGKIFGNMGAGIFGSAGAAIGGIGSAATGGAIVNSSGFLMAVPGAAGGAAAGGILAGMSGAAIVGAVGFAAVWLGTLFGTLFGKSAADKWEEEFSRRMVQEHGADWESMARKSVSAAGLKAPAGSSASTTSAGGGSQLPPGGSIQPGNIHVTLNVSAIDGADVERVVRDKIIPKIEEAAWNRGFRIPVTAVGGA